MLCGILHAVVDFSSALESEVQEDAFSSMYTKSWMIFFFKSVVFVLNTVHSYRF